VARECGYEFRLLDEVMRINEEQRQRFLRKVRTALWTLRGKTAGRAGIGVQGRHRRYPRAAILLVQALLQEGCQIAAYDPAAMERAREVLNSKTEFVSNPYEAASGADALLILTEWEGLPGSTTRLQQQLKYPIGDRRPQPLPARAMAGSRLYLLQRGPAWPETPVTPAEGADAPPGKIKKS